MTGPPYPRPVYGDNAIGRFEIGVSPIGTIPGEFDVWTTVISQWANSPRLMQLVENFADYVDPTQNIDDFYDLVMNLDTAQGYGLDVWGRIVGVVRTLHVAIGPYLGFEEATPSAGIDSFNSAPLYSGGVLTTNFNLSDNAFRTLIIAKAMANITDGSIPAINQILMTLFPHRGNCYVTEGRSGGAWFGFRESINAKGFNQAPFYSGQQVGTMRMTYTFEFGLSPVELAIVTQSGVLPKPTGVKATVVQWGVGQGEAGISGPSQLPGP